MGAGTAAGIVSEEEVRLLPLGCGDSGAVESIDNQSRVLCADSRSNSRESREDRSLLLVSPPRKADDSLDSPMKSTRP